jgi:ribosomal protein S18 acetylase RimI-like enzyme
LIRYRTFRNGDPPSILGLWNRSAQTRGFGRLAGCDNLESLLFSKPFFDPAGLQLAFANDDHLVGLCHAGFGCDETQSRLDRSMGVVCMLLVDPEYRCQGIGSRLLEMGQSYLRAQGALVQYVGAIHPINPFYLGMYGGSEMPGILESDASAGEFVKRRGYVVADTCFVFQQVLSELGALSDNRIPLLRRQVKLMLEPWPKPLSWWHACTLGPVASLRYDLVDRDSEAFIGKAWVWEMESFGRNWGRPSIGITDLFVAENRRRQGFGKLLLHSIMKHLQEQRIALVEIQTMERNAAARGLYASLGFRQVDIGHVYRLNGPR